MKVELEKVDEKLAFGRLAVPQKESAEADVVVDWNLAELQVESTELELAYQAEAEHHQRSHRMPRPTHENSHHQNPSWNCHLTNCAGGLARQDPPNPHYNRFPNHQSPQHPPPRLAHQIRHRHRQSFEGVCQCQT